LSIRPIRSPWLTRVDLENLLDEPERTWGPELKKLGSEELIERGGRGVSHHPFTYRRAPEKSAQSGPAQSAHTWGEGGHTTSLRTLRAFP
jgi:hypothetical protein